MRHENKFLPKLATVVIAPIANLAARIYVSLEFFRSGLAKIENWEQTVQKFETEWVVPLISPNTATVLATAGELFLPVMLVVGFFTRFAAAGLFCIAAVIEFIVYQGSGENTQHHYWLITFALLVGYGGNKISFDYFFRRNEDRRYRFS